MFRITFLCILLLLLTVQLLYEGMLLTLQIVLTIAEISVYCLLDLVLLIGSFREGR